MRGAEVRARDASPKISTSLLFVMATGMVVVEQSQLVGKIAELNRNYLKLLEAGESVNATPKLFCFG